MKSRGCLKGDHTHGGHLSSRIIPPAQTPRSRETPCFLLYSKAPTTSRATQLAPIHSDPLGTKRLRRWGQRQTVQRPVEVFLYSIRTSRAATAWLQPRRELRSTPRGTTLAGEPTSAPTQTEVTSRVARRAAPRERRAGGGRGSEARGGARLRLRFRWLVALAHPSCSHSLPWLLPPSWYFLEPPSWFFQSARTQNRK